MPKQGQKTLPVDVRRQLDKATEKIGRVLLKLSQGASDNEVLPELHDVLEPPLRAARQAGSARRHRSEEREVDFAMVVATHIRSLRRETGGTQAELATNMQRIGFDWKRITVAEVEAGADREGGGRRVSIEELLGLASLFAVPAVELMLPDDGDQMTVRLGSARIEQLFTADEVRELILGDGGTVGRGGLDWEIARARAGVTGIGAFTGSAASLAGEGKVSGGSDWRPAARLWAHREGAER